MVELMFLSKIVRNVIYKSKLKDYLKSNTLDASRPIHKY